MTLHVPQFARCLKFAAFALIVIAAPRLSSAEELKGEALADACTSCHGINGRSHGAIPSINDLSKDAFVQDLKAYRAQTKTATIMNRIARAYSDADIDALAEYFTTGAKP
ncbi:MAG TPA: c-type cytochrome [Steroidobacteraceae bacterium]